MTAQHERPAPSRDEQGGTPKGEETLRAIIGILVAEILGWAASGPLQPWIRVLLVLLLAFLGGVLFYYVQVMIWLFTWLTRNAKNLPGLLGHVLGAFFNVVRHLFSGLAMLSGRSLRAVFCVILLIAATCLISSFHSWPWTSCAIAWEVRLAASSETAPAVQHAAETFMRGTADWRGCRTANITIIAPDSASELRRRLASGWNATPPHTPGPRPVLWIADSPAEVTQIRAVSSARISRVTTVATSPLVIAMPQATAELITSGLDEPGAFTWAQLINGVRSPRAVLRTHPRTSNVGLLATVGLEESLPGEDKQAERDALEARIGGGVGWAEDVHDVMCRFLDADDASGDRVPAFIMSEQQLYEFNMARSGTGTGSWTRADCARAAIRPGPVPRLRPLYPSGTDGRHVPGLIYQCVPLDWADQPTPPAVSEIVRAFCDHLATALTRLGFRDADGRLPALDSAAELAADAAVAPEWPSDITGALARAAVPRLGDHVLLAVDVSGSMSNSLNTGGDRLRAATDTAKTLVAHMPGALTTGLWTYPAANPEATHEVLAPPAQVTDGGAALAALLDPVRLATNRMDRSLSRLVRAGVAELAGKDGHRVLVVLTDGGGADFDEFPLTEDSGVEIVLLTFGGRGCNHPGLAEGAPQDGLVCYPVDGAPPDHAVSSLRTYLTAAAGGAR